MHICTCYVCIANSPNCDHSAGGYSARDAMAASILNMIVMPMALPAQINSSRLNGQHAHMNVSRGNSHGIWFWRLDPIGS